MKKFFIFGCYHILHGGHIQFFKEARALGNHLTGCFASDKVLSLLRLTATAQLNPISQYTSSWAQIVEDLQLRGLRIVIIADERSAF